MTQTFKVGQTLWWLKANTVDEVTFVRYVPAEPNFLRPPSWYIREKGSRGDLGVLLQNLHTTREAAYEKGIKRLADKGSKAWKDYMAINDRLDKLSYEYREG